MSTQYKHNKHITAEDYDKFLKEMLQEIEQIAIEVNNDYKNNPSEMSGSVHEVHENSPVLIHEELKEKYYKKIKK